MAKAADDLPYRSCVGVVLAARDGRVFVGERLDTPGAWQMPQGGIDAGETPLEAALRELGEEIGVSPASVSMLGETPGWIRYDLPDNLVGKAFKGRFRGQEQKWMLMRFLGEDSEIRLDTEHPEFSRWRWMRLEDVLEGIVPFKRKVYDAVFETFAERL